MKPRGKWTPFAFFVLTCREEHKRRHPEEKVSFSELSRMCEARWKKMSDYEKKRFHEAEVEDPVVEVVVGKMHFLFEAVPEQESWYSTYQRHDRGDEFVFHPSSTTAPFLLPYEMLYDTFQASKSGRRDADTSRDQSNPTVRQLGSEDRNVNSRVKPESSIDMSKLAANLDSLLRSPDELSSAPLIPSTRSRLSRPKKAKKKKISSGSEHSGVCPLAQLVADNVDPVLLDCLEDELLTGSCPPLEDPMGMLKSYSTCTSMSVCNSRRLRPSRRDSLPSLQQQQREQKFENKVVKLPSPSKQNGCVTDKDDLPGFNIGNNTPDSGLGGNKREKIDSWRLSMTAYRQL